MNAARKSIAQSALATLLNESSGFNLDELDPNMSFPELGFDSLFLVQFTQNVKSRLKVKLTFRQLLEEVPNLSALIDYVAKNLPESQIEAIGGASATSVASAVAAVARPVVALAAAGNASSVSTPASSGNLVADETAAAMITSPGNANLPSSAQVQSTNSFSTPCNPVIAAVSAPVFAPVPAVDFVPQSPAPSSAPSSAPSFAPSVFDPAMLSGFNSIGSAIAVNGAGKVASHDGLAEIISQQNQLMSMQLLLLAGIQPSSGVAPMPEAASIGQAAPAGTASIMAPCAQTQEVPSPAVPSPVSLASDSSATDLAAVAPSSESSNEQTAAKKTYERFGPFKPVRRALGGGLTDQQQAYLDRLMERFTNKTAKSRAHAQRHRTHFADPRGVAGYRRIWKSMVYQISVERSQGSKLWDLDGNEFIDIAMGFGLNLFGQSPDFVTEALHQQLERGVEVGPQSPLAGEVAQLLCDFARQERATFCNTGSEAVMAAMRLARTVTGKDKIVFFNKDYHGNFDQVLVRSTVIGKQRHSQPAAPGVPQGLADQAIILDYGTAEALQVLQDRADEIAAVLVEPVQSADPFTQPREFLHEVRRITQENDIALVMDEVITGFRAAQGGAQEWFDVWGDMATYGKILGGGLPIGALTGSRRFMDALDGGDWRYEDNSEPEADMTFFAGTFVRHPLAMTAAYQILMKVKEEGPELQQQLTAKTTYLVNELNAFFAGELFPIRVAQFTSLFRFMFPPTVEYADLLYFHLLDRGIFTRGWGDNCFLSTAHSDKDIEKIIWAVQDSCREIRDGGFMPRPDEIDGLDNVSASASAATFNPSAAVSNREETSSANRTGAPVAASPVAGSISSGSAIANQGSRPIPRLSTLEEIRSEGSKIPLFCMPAADGLTLVFHELAERLGDDQPVYGLNSPGAYGEQVPYTIEEMAARFIEDIREEFPHGPYALIGYCSGGTIAFEAAQQLVTQGDEVVFLAGIETYDWGTAQSSKPTLWTKFYYNVQRLEFHVRNFWLLDKGHKREYLRSKWTRLKSRTAIWKGMCLSLFSKHRGTQRAHASQVNWNEVWRAHDAQADRYVKKPYSGQLLMIRPRKDYVSYLGKEELVAIEGVEYAKMDAYPTGLMSAPFVDQLAAVVRQRLAQAEEVRAKRTCVCDGSNRVACQAKSEAECSPEAHPVSERVVLIASPS